MTEAQWVFRHAGTNLIETPDLPAPNGLQPSAVWRWVATLWPDECQPDGWAALEWEPAPRGWWLPASLAIGDVIEFGVTWPHPGHGTAEAVRWYGWLERVTVHALIVVGPYDHPTDATEAARPTIDELRLDQLTPPTDTLAVATTDDW